MNIRLTSVFLCLLAFSVTSSQATIFVYYASGYQYSDLPIFQGSPYNMDLDQNSFIDFTFSNDGTGAKVTPVAGNEYCSYPNGDPRALNVGNPVAAPFSGGVGVLNTYFVNPTFKFLGLKLKVGQDFYYGWAEIKVSNYAELTMRRYAFSDVPNVPIEGGQLVGFEEDFAADFDLTVQGQELLVRTELYRKYPLKLKMATISGKTVAAFDIEASEKRVMLQELSSGIYLISVATRGQVVYQKKVFLH